MHHKFKLSDDVAINVYFFTGDEKYFCRVVFIYSGKLMPWYVTFDKKLEIVESGNNYFSR